MSIVSSMIPNVVNRPSILSIAKAGPRSLQTVVSRFRFSRRSSVLGAPIVRKSSG